MARAAWSSALLAVMCLTLAGAPPRRGRRSRRPTRRAPGPSWTGRPAPSSPASSSARLRQPAEPGSFLKIATLVAAFATGLASPDTRVPCEGEATVKGELIRCSHPRLRHPAAARRSRGGLVQRLVCDHRRATAARAARRRAGRPGPAADAGPRADAAGGHGPARVAVAAAGLGRGARRACCDSRPRCRCRARRGPPWSKDCAARRFTARPARSANAASTCWPRPAPRHQPAGGTLGVVVAAWPAECADARDRPGRRRRRRQGRRRPGRRRRRHPPREASRAPAPPPSAARRPPDPSAERSEAPPVASAERDPALRVGTPRPGGGFAVEAFAIEDYVARVLAGEAAAGSPPAALEALAVAVRTFAVGNRGRHQRDGFDLCTLTHCQVLRDALRRGARRGRGDCAARFCWSTARRPPCSTRHPAADAPSVRRRCGRAPTIRRTCPRSRTGPAGASLDGRPRSRCRISSGRSTAAGLSRVAAAGPRGGWPQCIGARRARAPGRDDAGCDLGPGPADGRGPHAGLAPAEEHRLHRPPHRRRLPVRRQGLWPRRRPVRAGLGASRRARRLGARDPARVLSRASKSAACATRPWPPGTRRTEHLPRPKHLKHPKHLKRQASPSCFPQAAEPERGGVDRLRPSRSRRPCAGDRAAGSCQPAPRLSPFGRELPAGNGRAVVDGGAHAAGHASICCRRPCFASAAPSSPRCGTSWRTC